MQAAAENKQAVKRDGNRIRSGEVKGSVLKIGMIEPGTKTEQGPPGGWPLLGVISGGGARARALRMRQAVRTKVPEPR
jgi:hypothetical protein